MQTYRKILSGFGLLALVLGCSDKPNHDQLEWKTLQVTATAYNQSPGQTSKIHPGITAWGDSLRPGVHWIAVSRDLLKKGLDYNTLVRIDTFSNIFIVKDKMHRRWKNRIDIFMGTDIEAAKSWGKRKVKIQYARPKDTLKNQNDDL